MQKMRKMSTAGKFDGETINQNQEKEEDEAAEE